MTTGFAPAALSARKLVGETRRSDRALASLSAIRSHNKAQVRLMVLLGAAGAPPHAAAPPEPTPCGCGPTK